MKKLSGVIFVLLIAALILGACKVREFTATPEPTATSEATEAPAAQATEPTDATAAPTEVVDTRLFDEDGKMICTIYEGFFPALTEEQAKTLEVFPEISDADWSRGPKDATLTVLEYSDFQCPACAAFYAELETLMAKYPDDVRLIFRNFPLVSIHPNAQVAAQAAEAAGLQDKYWEMYNALFSKQGDWSGMPAEDFLAWLKTEAGTLGLDAEQFATDLTSEAIVSKVAADLEYGQTTIGLNSTPTILLNGRPWSYDWSASTLGMVVDVLKYEKGNLETACPPWVIDQSKSYTATIETEKGDIVIQLFDDEAPLTVNSFVYLAEKGFFDGVTFHRVLHDFVAQAGDPSGTGISGSGYEFRDEIVSTLTYDEIGMVGMANAGANTNGSQFFITYVPATQLTGKYTIFGKVLEGMDVLQNLTERDPQNNPDAPAGDKIISITIEAK